MSYLFDPYFQWLSIPPEEQPPHHYRLLGVPLFISDSELISYAVQQRMAHLKSLQTGQQGAACQQLLAEISEAKACLLDVDRKAHYDTELRRQLPVQQGAAAGTSKRIPARPVPIPLAPSVTVEDPDWPIADVEDLVTRTTIRKSSPYKPKRRRSNWAYIALPLLVLAVMLGVGLFAYWSQSRAVVLPTVGKAHTLPATAPVPPAPGANAPPTNGKNVASPPPAVEKLPLADPAVQTRDFKPNSLDSPPSTSQQVATRDPLVQEGVSAPPANQGFPAGDEPAPKKAGTKPSTTGQAKVAAPDEAARAKALAEVKSILADDYAKLEKLELARKLLEYAQNSPPGSARTYALLQESGKAAVAAGDGALIFQLVDALASQFDNVQATETKAKALQHAAKVAGKPQAAALATFILQYTQTLQDEEKFDAAHDLSEAAMALGRKSGNSEIVRQATTRHKEIIALRQDYNNAAQAMAQLKAQPTDPQANEVVGKYYALGKGNWDKGLPMLAVSSDAALKEAATLDLAEPQDADKQVAVGDAWWALSAKATNASKTRLLARAVHWYQKALPHVESALAKIKIQKRLDEAGPQAEQQGPEKVATQDSAKVDRSGYRLVIWNTHNARANDRGTSSINISLGYKGKTVWEKRQVPLEWSQVRDPATEIRLPPLAFDVLRIEVAGFVASGPGLTEVEVYSGDKNIARGRPAIASSYLNSRSSYGPSAVTDGITQSSENAVGYWLARDKELGWVQIDFAE